MQHVSNKVHFPDLEEAILDYWKQNHIFQRSVEERSPEQEFIFYDGPPFATGLPHYGHLLAGTIKDVIPRYKTMQGHRVARRFGWDCHGLPVEFEIEKTLNLQGRPEIEEFGVARFNEECRSIVLRYTSEWRQTVERMGRWIDFDNDYKTMNLSFMESVWWVFQQLWKKGLIYEGVKVVPYSWRVSTPLSNFEANLNYKSVQDPSVTIRCRSVDEPNTFFLAWTTTPWTLPSNLGLCVGPDLDYVKVRDQSDGNIYYLGKALLPNYFTENYEVLETLKGSELAGRRYHPLFEFAKGQVDTSNAWQVLVDDYVGEDSGTGIVHQAPAFGEDDLRVCQKAGIPVFDPVDDDGNFKSFMDFVAGLNIKEADKLIIRRLKDEEKLFKQETVQHSYPFCWRTDTPLIYKAISTWFVSVETIKEQLIANNQTIRWVPEHLQSGRFGKWLENARDWAISRNRYWGTPLPIWKSEEGDILCFGSVKELEDATGKTIDDIHKHFVDDLVIEKDGKTYRRIPEVLDCWFESGSMPYAQQHYPFENKEAFEAGFPANFISEGLDQTRGWFYTLMVISTALFDKPAFQNVIVNGLVLAEDGKKMSKRLKNYPDPTEMIDRYGADAIRLYMLNSVAVQADDLRFTERGLIETTRSILLPLWNALAFLSTYAAIDQWQPTAETLSSKPENPLDRWILSKLNTLIETVSTNMDTYQLNKSVSPFVGFIDLLTNWYIRRSRRRFWKAGQGSDKQEAYATLYHVLLKLSQVIAPFVPFTAEAIYQRLEPPQSEESVHLSTFPSVQSDFQYPELEQEMELVLSVVNMGRSLRNQHQLKIRQPLAQLMLVTRNAETQSVLSGMIDLVKDELNLKEVVIAENEEELVSFTAKANFKALGPKFGKQMRAVAQAVEGLDAAAIQQLQSSGSCTIEVEGQSIELTPDEVLLQRHQKEGMLVLSEGDLTVALDTQLTPELIQEGFAREFVNKVQNMRKEHDLEVMDRIQISYHAQETLQQAIASFEDFIKTETLADAIELKPEDDTMAAWDLNGEACCIQITKQ